MGTADRRIMAPLACLAGWFAVAFWMLAHAAPVFWAVRCNERDNYPNRRSSLDWFCPCCAGRRPTVPLTEIDRCLTSLRLESTGSAPFPAGSRARCRDRPF
jgi:hypothetical protein